MSEQQPIKPAKRLPAFLTKPLEQLTYIECQRYIKYLLLQQAKTDIAVQKAHRLLTSVMP